MSAFWCGYVGVPQNTLENTRAIMCAWNWRERNEFRMECAIRKRNLCGLCGGVILLRFNINYSIYNALMEFAIVRKLGNLAYMKRNLLIQK